jgi:hypothetical protein
MAEKRIFSEVLTGLEHEGAILDELGATEPSNSEPQCAADIRFCDCREDDSRHLHARSFIDGVFEERFEVGVGLELRTIAVEGGDSFGPGRSQTFITIVWKRARDLFHELEALIRRKLSGFRQQLANAFGRHA